MSEPEDRLIAVVLTEGEYDLIRIEIETARSEGELFLLNETLSAQHNAQRSEPDLVERLENTLKKARKTNGNYQETARAILAELRGTGA